MAQYAYTFTSGDVVTPTKLNNARTVSEIVNADINNNAAIAGTKIAPDFGAQNVVTTGTLAAGTPSVLGATVVRQAKHISGGTVNAAVCVVTPGQGFISVNSEGSSSTFGAGSIALVRGRGTLGSPGLVNAGDWLGAITYQGHDGTGHIIAAKIQAEVDGTPGTNDMPGRLIFSTTADGASSVTERVRIDSDGNVGIGTSSPSYLLDVAGIVNTNATYRVNNTIVVGPRRTGWTAPTGTFNRGTFDSSTVTLPQLAARVHALIDDLAAHGLIDS